MSDDGRMFIAWFVTLLLVVVLLVLMDGRAVIDVLQFLIGE